MAKIDFDFNKELQNLAQQERKKNLKPPLKKGKNNTFIIVGVAVVIIVALFIFFKSKPDDKSNAIQTKQTASDNQSNIISTEVINNPDIKLTDNVGTTPLIKTVKIRPTNPTILDTIKAEVEFSNPQESREFTLKYQWFINNTNQIVGADTDTLPPGKAKKGDFVNVRVMAYKEDKVVYQINSDMYMIVNSSPNLSMKVLSNRVKKGSAIEIQLIATDAEGDKVTYSLDEAPSGMSIDSSTGRILYKPDKSGTISFKASATDSDGAKTSGTFEIQLNIE